jgi:hypothetical protein
LAVLDKNSLNLPWMKDQPDGAVSNVQLRQAIFDEVGLPGAHTRGEATQIDLDGAASALIQTHDPASSVVGGLQPSDLYGAVL